MSKKRKIQHELQIYFCFFVTVALCIIIGSGYYISKRNLEHQISAQIHLELTEMVQNLAIDNSININNLKAWSDIITVQNFALDNQTTKVDQLLNTLLSKYLMYSQLAVFDSNGTVIASTYKRFNAKSVFSNTWYKEIMSGDHFVGSFEFSQDFDEHGKVYAVPIIVDKNIVLGGFIGFQSSETMNDRMHFATLLGMEQSENNQLYVVDSQTENLIYSTDEKEVPMKFEDNFDSTSYRDFIHIKFDSASKNDNLNYSEYLQDPNVTIMAKIHKSLYTSEIINLRNDLLQISIFLLFIFILLIKKMSDKITNPILSLAKQIQSFDINRDYHENLEKVLSNLPDAKQFELSIFIESFSKLASKITKLHRQEIKFQSHLEECVNSALEKYKASSKLSNQLGNALDNSSNLVVIFDPETFLMLYANKTALKSVGYTLDEIQEMKFTDLIPVYNATELSENLENLYESNVDVLQFETSIHVVTGSEYPAEIKIYESFEEEGRKIILAIISDVTERVENEKQLRYLSFYDPLTNLPNRQLFTEQLKLALKESDRTMQKLALMVIDVDNFKRINDTLGHSVGDELLQSLAHQLVVTLNITDYTNSNSMIARQGGDEFVLFIKNVSSDNQLLAIANKIMSIASRSFELSGLQVRVTLSVGIAVYPNDGEDWSELLKHADIAMYSAKELGKNAFNFYERKMNVQMLKSLQLEEDMRLALAKGEFYLDYQPQIDIKKHKIVGVEALIRWKKASGEKIMPDEFISLAEEIGLIQELTILVLKKACKQGMEWDKAGLEPLTIGVNISSSHFVEGLIVEDVKSALQETGFPAERLELEITESLLLNNAYENIEILGQLKDLGCKLAIDDFGTGYSSLSYLQNFNLDCLKVDKAFINRITEEKTSHQLVSAIIAMATSLGLEVIIEGLESIEQLNMIKDYNAYIIQGYYFSKPVNPQEIINLSKDMPGSWFNNAS